MKPCFHSLIPFLPLFCNCQFNSSTPKLISRQAGVSKLDSVLLNWTLLYNHLAWTMQKTQPLNCWEGVFIALLHSNSSYSIVSCVLFVAGICLPSRCLPINGYSDFAIPAFGRHATILLIAFDDKDHTIHINTLCEQNFGDLQYQSRWYKE
jgi:hypothetical protein